MQHLLQLSDQYLLYHHDLYQMMVNSPTPLFLKYDYGKISVKRAFSLVALSRMSHVHQSMLEGCSF